VVIAFALTRTIWVSHVLLFLAGASLVMVFSLITSLVQLIAPDHLRGRVMSAYMVAFRGGSPLGSLASGYIASISSTPVVLALNGSLLMLVAATCLAMVPRLRRL
jgi:predicted MFS family arabinose efflux permease